MFEPHVIDDSHKITVNTSAVGRLVLLPFFLIVLPFQLFFLTMPLIYLKIYGLHLIVLQAWGIGWVAAAITAGLEWPLWIAINPWHLHLDLDRREYRLVQGCGPWARIRTGTTQDIRGLYLKPPKDQSRNSRKVVLEWKMRRLPFVLRITHNDPGEAQEWLQNLASRLDVPRLDVSSAPDKGLTNR